MTGDEVVAALPQSVRVGPYDFAIVKDGVLASFGERRWGACSTMEQIIRVQAVMPTATKAVDTFFHETMHAVFWAYGIADEDKEERTVAALGTALVALHRDNPWLAPWVIKALT